MGNHLDLMCTKLRSTEEELQETKDHLDLACTKLTNTEEELHNTKEHLDLACTKLKNTEEEFLITKEQFKEITKKLHERIDALENKPYQEAIYIYTWKINGVHSSDSFCPAFCVFYALHSLNTHWFPSSASRVRIP